mmetsp:Transcript_77534/g.251009  ORF Transcript_77534/g.251009 Transcript_77534/m.251009 type:complete len:80 (+) Transcript_77534:172-411(+)
MRACVLFPWFLLDSRMFLELTAVSPENVIRKLARCSSTSVGSTPNRSLCMLYSTIVVNRLSHLACRRLTGLRRLLSLSQ